MTSYYVELTFNFDGTDRDVLFDHLDDVMDAFMQLDGMTGDVAVDGNDVTLCITLDATNRTDAITGAVAGARTCVHTAGGATPGWENIITNMIDGDRYRSQVEPSELITC